MSFRFFKNPVLEEAVIFSEVAVLRIAVEQHLKSKSRLPVTITLRGDVYKVLFRNKGSMQAGWHLSTKEDFPAKCFPLFWDHFADSCGQGIKVIYPIKVRHFISWSLKKYNVLRDHHPSPRVLQEKVYFFICKDSSWGYPLIITCVYVTMAPGIYYF